MNIIEWRNYLCENENISSRAKHIGLTLSLFYREGKRTYPTIDTLCQWSSLAPNTISGALKDLQKAGFIDIKSYRLPNAKFRGHEYLFLGLLSDCNSDEKHSPPANFEGSTEVTIEAAIEAAIEPSNFEGKEEEIEEVEEKKERKNIKKENKPKNVSVQTWEDFKRLREKKKAPITETVINGIMKEAAKANYNLEEALQECCTRGWQSFKAEWVNKGEGNENINGSYGTIYQNSYSGATASQARKREFEEAAVRGMLRAENPDF